MRQSMGRRVKRPCLKCGQLVASGSYCRRHHRQITVAENNARAKSQAR